MCDSMWRGVGNDARPPFTSDEEGAGAGAAAWAEGVAACTGTVAATLLMALEWSGAASVRACRRLDAAVTTVGVAMDRRRMMDRAIRTGSMILAGSHDQRSVHLTRSRMEMALQ